MHPAEKFAARCTKEARDDEEDIDADEAAARAPEIDVKEHDQRDAQRTQAIDVTSKRRRGCGLMPVRRLDVRHRVESLSCGYEPARGPDFRRTMIAVQWQQIRSADAAGLAVGALSPMPIEPSPGLR